jgi:hypothetical protein
MTITFKKSVYNDIEQYIKGFRNDEMAIEAFLDLMMPVLECCVMTEVEERLKKPEQKIPEMIGAEVSISSCDSCKQSFGTGYGKCQKCGRLI